MTYIVSMNAHILKGSMQQGHNFIWNKDFQENEIKSLLHEDLQL